MIYEFPFSWWLFLVFQVLRVSVQAFERFESTKGDLKRALSHPKVTSHWLMSSDSPRYIIPASTSPRYIWYSDTKTIFSVRTFIQTGHPFWEPGSPAFGRALLEMEICQEPRRRAWKGAGPMVPLPRGSVGWTKHARAWWEVMPTKWLSYPSKPKKNGEDNGSYLKNQQWLWPSKVPWWLCYKSLKNPKLFQ